MTIINNEFDTPDEEPVGGLGVMVTSDEIAQLYNAALGWASGMMAVALNREDDERLQRLTTNCAERTEPAVLEMILLKLAPVFSAVSDGCPVHGKNGCPGEEG